MSVLNEMRRTQKTNLEFKARRLRGEIDNLCRLIQINLDCSLKKPEDLPVGEIDAQWDELKSKWADLSVANVEIARLEQELK
jgi:hypothetical protein